MKDIEKFENFLTEEEFEIVHEDAWRNIRSRKDSEYLASFQTNYTLWDKSIIHKSSVVLITHINNAVVKNILDNKIFNAFNKTPLSYMYYYWTNGSYIPWHDDGHQGSAATLYMNCEWDKDWGGYYMYESNESEIKAVKPEKNLFILQHNHTPHCVTPVIQGSPHRVSIQIFFS